MDVRTGGTYRLGFSAGDHTAEFFGKYLEVTPYSRLIWTNDEGGVDAANLTTVPFEDVNGIQGLSHMSSSDKAFFEACETETLQDPTDLAGDPGFVSV